MNQREQSNSMLGCIGIVILVVLLTGCVMEAAKVKPWLAATTVKNAPLAAHTTALANPDSSSPAVLPFVRATRAPGAAVLSPTPDSPHPLPTLRTDQQQYVVGPGDTLRLIAQHYGVDLNALIEANKLENPDLLAVGQSLVIPAPNPAASGSAFKVIPDSELVYGPASVGFDAASFIQSKKGYLAAYTEDINGVKTTAAEDITRVAYEYSVNPRLLLAAIEYESGWVTNPNPAKETLDAPLRLNDATHKGLYRQLSWAANALNRGFYLWRVNAVASWVLTDGSVVPVDATINAGTAGVQELMSQYYGRAEWIRPSPRLACLQLIPPSSAIPSIMGSSPLSRPV
jgi:LasA protease